MEMARGALFGDGHSGKWELYKWRGRRSFTKFQYLCFLCHIFVAAGACFPLSGIENLQGSTSLFVKSLDFCFIKATVCWWFTVALLFSKGHCFAMVGCRLVFYSFYSSFLVFSAAAVSTSVLHRWKTKMNNDESPGLLRRGDCPREI
ncbi:hypothetical protein A2U01_0038894, partial [Trifolium medium]|nr:hypothetical protein [Trifolium medium]